MDDNVHMYTENTDLTEDEKQIIRAVRRIRAQHSDWSEKDFEEYINSIVDSFMNN